LNSIIINAKANTQFPFSFGVLHSSESTIHQPHSFAITIKTASTLATIFQVYLGYPVPFGSRLTIILAQNLWGPVAQASYGTGAKWLCHHQTNSVRKFKHLTPARYDNAHIPQQQCAGTNKSRDRSS